MENYMMWQDYVALVAVFMVLYAVVQIYVTSKLTAAVASAGKAWKINLSKELWVAAIGGTIIYWHLFIC